MSEFIENDIVADIHHTGRGLSEHPDKDLGRLWVARGLFEQALSTLDNDPPSIDKEVQAARIWRDYGFSLAREFVVGRVDAAPHAHNLLVTSLRKTITLLDDGAQSPERRAELYVERGTTESMIGRLVVAVQVANGDITTRNKVGAGAVQDQKWFGPERTHRHFLRGNNGLARTTNAMYAARTERMNGRVLHVVPWIGRAIASVGFSLSQDHKSIVPSVKLMAHIGWRLRSREAAFISSKLEP